MATITKPYVTDAPGNKTVRRRYRHPEVGEFHKFDLSRGSVRTTMVPDAALAGLTTYLDSADQTEEHESVVRILTLMLELQSIEPPLWDERIDAPMTVMRQGVSVPNPILKKLAPTKYDAEMRITQTQSLINRELAQYQFSPWIFCTGRKYWMVMWRVHSMSPERGRVKKGVMQMDYGAALQLILDLAKAGYLGRLRRCACCGKWLYAKFRHQNYCSTKCQQEHYRKSDEWKRKRRLYMRDYRNK